MKRILFTLAMACLMGCASAPATFKSEEFVWKRQHTDLNYEEVFKRITDGGRRCTGLNHFRPAGYYLAESGAGHFDIFLPNMLGIQTSFVGGRIEFTKDASGCIVEIGKLRKYYNDNDSMGMYRQFEGYLAGTPGCWEPD